MKKNIFLIVTGLAISAIVMASYEIYKATKGIKEVADTPEDFPIYTNSDDED